MNANRAAVAMKEDNTSAAETAKHSMGKRLTIFTWMLQIVAAGVLFQTLFFKFTAAEESVFIFQTLGMEPWGRIGSGVAELIASVLLLIPRTVVRGAVLGLGIISGAILSHVTKLGIVVRNDGGLLFILALVVFACCAGILLVRRRQLSALMCALLPSRGFCASSSGSGVMAVSCNKYSQANPTARFEEAERKV